MVSAATNNSKTTEKPAEPGNETPLNSIVTIIEHKIRNLEKRKVSFMSADCVRIFVHISLFEPQ